MCRRRGCSRESFCAEAIRRLKAFIIRNMSNSANFVFTRVLSVLCLTLLLGACASSGDSGPGGVLEHQLMAEIAFQRGEYQVAMEEYLALADESGDAKYARRATELAYEFGYDQLALDGAELWVDLAPEESLAHAFLGRMYLRSNARKRAWTHLDMGMGPEAEREDRDYLGLSVELADSVPPARALSVFQRFNEPESDRAGVWAGLATLEAAAGDYEQAVKAARRTVQLAPDWTLARIWLARFLLLSGDRASAFEQMAFALEMNPGLEMELEFVQLLALADAETDARERIERLEERYPRDPDLLRTRALLLVGWNDLDAAREDFTLLLSEAYFVNESFWYLGEIAYRQERYLEAIRYFTRINKGSWLVRSRNAISQAFLALGDGDTALAVQRELAADFPKHSLQTLLPQAEMLAEMGRTEEALELTEIVIAQRPWDQGGWLFRGALMEQAGDLKSAVDAFEEAVDLAPDSAVALNALGYTLANNGRDFADAQRYIEQALAMEPENPAYLDSLGWVYYQRGDTEGALPWLQQAFTLMPDAEIAAHLGEVLWELDRRDEAIDIWAEALTAAPDDQTLLETTERYLQ